MVMQNNEILAMLHKKFDEKTGEKRLLVKTLEAKQGLLEEKLLEYENCLRARAIVQEVAKETQKNIEIHIGNIVSLALATVFPDPYDFFLRFQERRNATEADLIFSKNGNETDDILNSGGGGVADIASFALRIALWSLKQTRPTFILDEPDKFLHSYYYQERASEMMKELCQKFGIQIIMVSDQDNIKFSANKVINLRNIKGVSHVIPNEEI